MNVTFECDSTWFGLLIWQFPTLNSYSTPKIHNKYLFHMGKILQPVYHTHTYPQTLLLKGFLFERIREVRQKQWSWLWEEKPSVFCFFFVFPCSHVPVRDFVAEVPDWQPWRLGLICWAFQLILLPTLNKKDFLLKFWFSSFFLKVGRTGDPGCTVSQSWLLLSSCHF